MTTATITDHFKRELIDGVYEEFLDSDNIFYIGIGRSNPWEEPDSDTNPPFPVPSAYESRKFLENMQSLKRVEDASKVTQRYNYTEGNIYSGWNDDNHSLLVYNAAELGLDPCIGDYGFKNPYYVITSSNRVYVCIKGSVGANGLPAPSTILPTEQGESGFNVFETADGYQWKYLFTVGTSDTQKFLTSGYVPSHRITDSDDGGPANDDLDLFKQEQAELQRKSIPGEIIGVEIVNGGDGYTNTTNTSNPNDYLEIEFTGEALTAGGTLQTITPARAWARVISGRIVDVTMKEPGTTDYYFGQGYANASARFVGSPVGIGAELRPILSPKMGLGYDAAVDLNSTAIMFNVILEGTENGSYIVGNDFRQIGLVKNPLQTDSDGSGNITSYTPLRSATSLALNKMIINESDPNYVPENITGDNILEQSNGAKGILNSVQDDTFYYTQTQETGYVPFTTGNVTISNGGGSTSIISLSPSGVDKQSPEVYYIDNRPPFIRSTEQTEDIKIVMDF